MENVSNQIKNYFNLKFLNCLFSRFIMFINIRVQKCSNLELIIFNIANLYSLMKDFQQSYVATDL